MFAVHQVKVYIWDPKMFTTVRERGWKWGWFYSNNYIKTYPCVP